MRNNFFPAQPPLLVEVFSPGCSCPFQCYWVSWKEPHSALQVWCLCGTCPVPWLNISCPRHISGGHRQGGSNWNSRDVNGQSSSDTTTISMNTLTWYRANTQVYLWTPVHSVLTKEKPWALWWSWYTSLTKTLPGRVGALVPFCRQDTWNLPELQQDVRGKAQEDCSPTSRIGTKAWEEFSHMRYLAFTSFSSQTFSSDTENIAMGMSALCYSSFGFALRVLFVKLKWDHRSAVQGAKGREDRNFQQVSCKEMVPRTGFPLKEIPANILFRYSPCVVATAKSVSLFLAGVLIHSSLHR